MTNVSPSVQLYSLRDHVAADLDGTLQRVAEIGYSQVEPYGFVDQVGQYQVLLGKHGLIAPSGHAQLIGQGEAVHDALAAAKLLGMKFLIDPYTVPTDWKEVAKIDYFADELNRVATIAKDYGVRIGYHNHSWELSERVNGEVAFDYFISKLNADVVIEVDTYWCEVGGASAADFLKKHADRIVAIHVKDGTKDGDVDKQVPAGQGEIPIAEIIQAAGANVIPVVEFDFYKSGDVFLGITESLKKLKELQR